MRKDIATLALAAFSLFFSLSGYVHVGKTVKTPHGVYHKGYTHAKHGYVHVGKTVKTPHGVYHKGGTYHAY